VHDVREARGIDRGARGVVPEIALMAAPELLYRWHEAFTSANGPSANVRHVLHVLSRYMKPDGTGAWPSQSTLAQKTNLGERTVRRALAEAARLGWILRRAKRDPRRDGRSWRRTEYMATLPKAAATVAAASAQFSKKVRPITTKRCGQALADELSTELSKKEVREARVHSQRGARRTPASKPKETAMKPTELPGFEVAGAEHQGARTPTRKRTFRMPADWRPNTVNGEWLTASGMSSEQQDSVITEFVRFERNAELLKSERGWQLAFSRNPIVKRAIAAAKGGRHGPRQERETAYARAGRKLREWCEREGLDPDDVGIH
jgi:hypothetical protein